MNISKKDLEKHIEEDNPADLKKYLLSAIEAYKNKATIRREKRKAAKAAAAPKTPKAPKA